MATTDNVSFSSLDWTDLPLELQDLIFGTHQTFKSIKALRLVSKRWYRACSRLRLSFEKHENWRAEKLLGFCAMFPRVEALRIVSMTPFSVEPFGHLCDLKFLQLHPEELNALKALSTFRIATTLRSLHTLNEPFSGARALTTEAISALSAFRNLESLTLRKTPLRSFLPALSSLRFLTSLVMFPMPDSVRTQTFSLLPHSLQSLSLTGTFQLSEEDVNSICSLPSLRSLALAPYDDGAVPLASAEAMSKMSLLEYLDAPSSFITDEALERYQNMGALTRLSTAYEVHQLSLKGVALLAQYCSNLRELDVAVQRPPHTVFSVSEDLHALFLPLSKFPLLRKLFIASSNSLVATDRCIGVLSTLRYLEDLTLFHCTQLTDAAMETISCFTNLTILRMIEAPFDLHSLKRLSSLKKLRQLAITETVLGRVAFESILSSTRHLRKLKVHSTSLFSDIPSLSLLHSLTSLDVSSNGFVDDDTLLYLSNLSRLAKLDIRDTSVRGDGFRDAKYGPSLSRLEFDGCKISLEGATHIAKFTNVTSLENRDAPFAPGVLSLLLTHVPYELVTVSFTEELLPALLQCTTIRTLTLLNTRLSPIIHQIDNALPELSSFQLYRNIGGPMEHYVFRSEPKQTVPRQRPPPPSFLGNNTLM